MCWTEAVQTALKQGAEYHKEAAELIMAAMVAHSLSQREVGKALEKSTTWISRLLKWYKGGAKVPHLGLKLRVGGKLRRRNRNPTLLRKDGAART